MVLTPKRPDTEANTKVEVASTIRVEEANRASVTRSVLSIVEEA